MRVVVMHKQDTASEAGLPPSNEIVAAMGQLIGGTSGFLLGAGLHQSARRTRLKLSDGKRTLTNGPYAGANELPAGFVLITVSSKEEAIEWATRYATAFGDIELEIGEVKEPWDIGICAKPEGHMSIRYLLLHKADKNEEAGISPSPEIVAAARQVFDDMTKAGVLLAAEGFQPSSEAKRLKVSGGTRVVIDGPFTESKELIGGFSLLRIDAMEQALEWTQRYADVLRNAYVGEDLEIDIRQLREP